MLARVWSPQQIPQVSLIWIRKIAELTIYFVSFRKYDEARKAYLNALKFDNGNLNVLRDLSLLQVQLKDYEGFAESRRRIMIAKPTELVNWTSYMVAIYLTGDYKTALEVFDTVEQTINGIENAEKKPKPHEKNEIYLFKAKILEDQKDWKAGIKFLTKKSVEKIVLDDVRKNEFLSKFYFNHGLTKKAVDCLEKLL